MRPSLSAELRLACFTLLVENEQRLAGEVVAAGTGGSL